MWTHSRPAVVLGCSQRSWLEPVRARLSDRVPVYVRESGGGVVLVGPWMVTVSVILPRGHWWLQSSWSGASRRLALVHAKVLDDLGVGVKMATRAFDNGKSRSDSNALAWACFGHVSPGELIAHDGRKLVGIAQRVVSSRVLLVAGTLHAPPPWILLCDATGRPRDAAMLDQVTTSCVERSRRMVSAGALAVRLRRALASALFDSPADRVNAQGVPAWRSSALSGVNAASNRNTDPS